MRFCVGYCNSRFGCGSTLLKLCCSVAHGGFIGTVVGFKVCFIVHGKRLCYSRTRTQHVLRAQPMGNIAEQCVVISLLVATHALLLTPKPFRFDATLFWRCRTSAGVQTSVGTRAAWWCDVLSLALPLLTVFGNDVMLRTQSWQHKRQT